MNAQQLQNKVTSLEQQLELLRKKVDLEVQRYGDAVKSFEDRTEADKAALKTVEERAVQAETQLSSVQQELAGSQFDGQQLKSLHQQVDQYRSIADRMEEQLKTSNEADQIFRRDTEQQLLNITKERNNFARNLQEAQEKIKVKNIRFIFFFLKHLYVYFIQYFRLWKMKQSN